MNDVENNVETPVFTAAEQLELERVTAERLKAEAVVNEQRRELAKLESEQRALKERDAVNNEIAKSKIRFHEPALVMQLARQQYQVEFDGASMTGTADGEKLPLSTILERIATEHPELADGRTTRSLREEAKPLARSTMSQQQKIDYIAKHGLNEFTKLPARANRIIEVRTFKDYLSLPQSARMELVGKNGTKWLESLPRN